MILPRVQDVRVQLMGQPMSSRTVPNVDSLPVEQEVTPAGI